jgi:hypothetical protein
MEILLMVAIIVVALSVLAQAGVLIAMFLQTRRLSVRAESLMNDAEKLLAPLESVTQNLKVLAVDLAETGKIARDQVTHVRDIIGETEENVRTQILEARRNLAEVVEECRRLATLPAREYTAFASGVKAGWRTFFSRRSRGQADGSGRGHRDPAA